MTFAIVIAIFAITVALMLWNIGVMRRFKSDYRYVGEFHGQRYESVLKFANMETDFWCFLGADASALYLLTASDRKRRWWTSRYRGVSNEIFKTDLRIPWMDLGWKEKTILFKDYIWFEIPEKKIYFTVPKDAGDKLLVDAGRKIPASLSS